MAIPHFPSLTLPLLRIANSGEFRTRDAVEQLANQFALSAAERDERLPSGGQTKFANRVHWAIAYLSRAGLVVRLSRGLYGISDRGRTVLEHPPVQIDLAFLYQFDGMKEFNKGAPRDQIAEGEPGPTLASTTPEERIDAAFEELNNALRAELLERLRGIHPAAFERLIIDLMLGMGYGAGGSGQHLGKTSDGGVDGVINEDVLGMDVIYLQAKRYAAGNGIGVDKIREFAGALDERGAAKGVFITTSHFAPQARQYAIRSPKRIILIDGEELTRLLVKHGVATRPSRTLEIKKLDTDYFDELDA